MTPQEQLYKLKLFETTGLIEDIRSDLFTTAMRVPGGWIFRSYDKGYNMMSSVFVIFDDEFEDT